MLATFTIAPPGFMVRNACFVKCTAPKRSTLRTFCQSSDVSSSRDLKVISPALLTTTSSLAKRSIAAFTVPATCTSEETSHATPSASGAPASRKLAALLSAASPFRSAMTTRAPSDPRRLAVARPIPLAAPVTIATLSRNRIVRPPTNMRPAGVVGRIDPAPAQIAVMCRSRTGYRAHRLSNTCSLLPADSRPDSVPRTDSHHSPQRFSRTGSVQGQSGSRGVLYRISSLRSSALHLHDLTLRHHVVVEVCHDPQRASDQQEHDQHAKGERERVVRVVGRRRDVQEEHEVHPHLRDREDDKRHW